MLGNIRPSFISTPPSGRNTLYLAGLGTPYAATLYGGAALLIAVSLIIAAPVRADARSDDSQLTPNDQEKLEKLIASYQAKNDTPLNDAMKNLENQFRERFKLLKNTELHFAASVCKMSPRERRFLKEASDEWLTVALRKYVVNQFRNRNGAGRFVVVQHNGNQVVQRQGAAAAMNPSTLMANGIQKACAAILAPEAFANYQQELEHRAASRRLAGAQAMVVELDGQLVLTAEQRQRLLAKLLENWDDQWNNQLPAFGQGGQFVPRIPQEIVIEILTDNQKKFYARAWQTQRQVFLAPALPAVNLNIQVQEFNIEIDD